MTYAVLPIEPLTLYVTVDLYLYNTITITAPYRSLLSRSPAAMKAFLDILSTTCAIT